MFIKISDFEDRKQSQTDDSVDLICSCSPLTKFKIPMRVCSFVYAFNKDLHCVLLLRILVTSLSVARFPVFKA